MNIFAKLSTPAKASPPLFSLLWTIPSQKLFRHHRTSTIFPSCRPHSSDRLAFYSRRWSALIQSQPPDQSRRNSATKKQQLLNRQSTRPHKICEMPRTILGQLQPPLLLWSTREPVLRLSALTLNVVTRTNRVIDAGTRLISLPGLSVIELGHFNENGAWFWMTKAS